MCEDGPSLDVYKASPARTSATAALWGYGDLAGAFVAVLVMFFLVSSAIILPVQAATSEDSPEALAAQVIATVTWNASMVLIVFWFVRRRGGSSRNLGFARPQRDSVTAQPQNWYRFAGFIAACYVASIFFVGLYGVLVNALDIDVLKPSEQIPKDFFAHDWLIAMLGIAVVLAAPVAEEVFFRGFVFGGLRRRLPFVLAASISGVLFSLAHADPGLVLPFTIVGIVLAYAYERSGTLLASIGVHCLFNLISFTLLVLNEAS
jgi:membrane protease YdiL (CAAX protease family)